MLHGCLTAAADTRAARSREGAAASEATVATDAKTGAAAHLECPLPGDGVLVHAGRKPHRAGALACTTTRLSTVKGPF